MNSVSVNLNSYCLNYVFLHNYAWPNLVQLAKMWSFFFYKSTDVNTLRNNIQLQTRELSIVFL